MVNQSLYAYDAAGDLDLGANQTTGSMGIGVVQTSGDIDIGTLAARTGAINIGTGASATHTTTLGNVGQTTSATNIHSGVVTVESHGTTLDLTAATTATLSGNAVAVDATGGNVVVTASGTASTDAAIISLETSAGDLTLATDAGSSVIANGYSMKVVSGELTNIQTGSLSLNNPGYSTCTYWNWGPMWVVNCNIYWSGKNGSISAGDKWLVKGLPFTFPSGTNPSTYAIYSRSNWCGCDGTNWLSLGGVAGTNTMEAIKNHSTIILQGNVNTTSAFKFTITVCVP